MNKSTLRWLVPAAVVLAAVMASQFLIAMRPEMPRRAVTAVTHAVPVEMVEPQRLKLQVKSQGTVSPKRQISLISEVAGRVLWVAPEFVAGGMVGKGFTLLRIDPIDYEVAVADARAAIAAAELSLAENRAVLKRAAVDEAEARLVAARARLRQVQADLSNTEITAPFDAVIDRKRVDTGQYVVAGTELMTLLGTDCAEVRLPVSAADLPFLPTGGSLQNGDHPVSLLGRYGSEIFEWRGRIARIENRVDPVTRVFYLVAEVDFPYDSERHGRQLSSGMFVEARIDGLPLADAVRLPRSALHTDETVFVVVAEGDEEVLRERQVRVVRREAERVIIDRGLKSGDRVVTSHLDLMVDGMPVRAVPGR